MASNLSIIHGFGSLTSVIWLFTLIALNAGSCLLCTVEINVVILLSLCEKKQTNKTKHRVTIPCKWVFRFHMKSAGLHEICMKSGEFQVKSGGFHVKSTQNLVKAGVSTKTIQFDECRRGAMTLDFMKSGFIAPSMHPPKLKSFC